MNYCPNCGKKLETGLPVTCQYCGESFWKNPSCCVGAVIESNGCVLLVKRNISPWKGYWDIPGGYCEAHETTEECVIREVMEEIGIKIEVSDIHGIWNEKRISDYYGDNICIYYNAKIIEVPPNTQIDNEILEMKWFAYDNLPKKIHPDSSVINALEKWKEKFYG